MTTRTEPRIRGEQYAVGTELRTAHGTRWVKIGDNSWRVRTKWGVLDAHTCYFDHEVYGEVIATGVKA